MHLSKGFHGITNTLSREEAILINESMKRIQDKGVECAPINDAISSTCPDLTKTVMSDVWTNAYGVPPSIKYG